jgi:heat shock protein 4
MDGEDLVYNLSRDEFEKIIEPVTTKFEKICKNALQKFEKETKIKIKNIHSIEMVGDTVRTPIISDIIKKVFGKEISKTLVPDECIARGCALYAMMNSPYYTIQNFEFSQYNHYTIEMEYPFLKEGKEVTKRLNIINNGSHFPANKTITFTNTQLPDKEKIPLKFYYKECDEINWLENKLLNSYFITLKKKKEKDWKFTLKYDLDINCIPKLELANLVESKLEMVPVIETPKTEEKKNRGKKTRR